MHRGTAAGRCQRNPDPLHQAEGFCGETGKLIRYADIAVTAAQQIYTPEEWDIKKKYVQDFLTSKGYDINLTEVDAAIEAAVKRVKKELGA